MDFYNPPKEMTVGSYYPSSNFNQYTHFAVMNSETTQLEASVGYFQPIKTPKVWCFDSYRQAFSCIEQGVLYSKADKLLKLVEKQQALINTLSKHLPTSSKYYHLAQYTSDVLSESEDIIKKATDITEPVSRLLGKDALLVLGGLKNGTAV